MESEIDENEAALLEAMSVNDLEELPEYRAFAGKALEENTPPVSREKIIEALKTVSDPEIMINVYDMGLIYKIEQRPNGYVYIEMTLTAPACPVAGILPQQVADALAAIDGVGQTEVLVVWEPAWTPDRMSDEAKLMLNMF